MNLIEDPKAHATTLAEMIRKASEGYEVGNVRAHREQWAIVIAALEQYAKTPAPEEARDSDAKDAARWRWLLSHNAMPSANGDYGTPSIEFHLPEEQQGQWIARGGEELNRVVDSFLPQSNESKLACVHRGGCRKVNECMAEQRCTALDAANERSEGK